MELQSLLKQSAVCHHDSDGEHDDVAQQRRRQERIKRKQLDRRSDERDFDEGNPDDIVPERRQSRRRKSQSGRQEQTDWLDHELDDDGRAFDMDDRD